jgi:hypothetical protein
VNRLEATQNVLKLEAAAAQLRERAKAIRLEMDADAQQEFKEQGAAPTWRLKDLGTWSLPVSRDSVAVTDPDAFLDWLAERYPTEVEQIRRPRKAFFDVLTQFLAQEGADVVHRTTGEMVPGLEIRPGGRPLTLRFKPNSDALAVADQVGAKLAGQILDGLGIAAGGDPE